jgi:hypothetical protein
MGFQSPQFESPVNMMGNMMKLKSMQQQNALAEQQMADLTLQRNRAAALDAAYKGAYNPQTGEIDYNTIAGRLAEGGQGTAIPGLLKTRDETLKARYDQAESRAKAFIQEGNMFQSELQNLSANDPSAPALMAQYIQGHHSPNSITGQLLKEQGITPQQSLAALENAVKTGKFGEFLQRSQMGANEWYKANAPKFTQVDYGGGVYTQSIPGMGGAATEVQGSRVAKTPTPGELLTNARAKVDPMQYPLLAAAVAEGRMSPDRVNSRNAAFLEQALQRNPTADLNAMAARGALMRNAGFQQKAISAEIIPEVLQNVVNAGKKLDFSDVKFIANIQKWTAGQLQDPKLTEYMTLRNDSLLSIAATMRLVGMSDYATKLEEEAAAPTMSPKQLDAWMSGQMKALNPRLKKLAGLSIDGANPAAPSGTPAAAVPADGVDHSNPLLGGKP